MNRGRPGNPLFQGPIGYGEPRQAGDAILGSSFFCQSLMAHSQPPVLIQICDPEGYTSLSVGARTVWLGVGDRKAYACAQLFHSCPTLCDPMDCSPPGSSVHGVLQARILEWVSISCSRGSSRPRDWTWVSCVSCITQVDSLPLVPPGKPGR